MLVCDLPKATLVLEHTPEVQHGSVIGLARVFALPETFVGSDGTALLPGALMPGPHLLISRDGVVQGFEIRSAGERAEQGRGSHKLTVRAPPSTRVYVVPANDDGFREFVEQMGSRAGARAVPEAGELVWDRLARNRWSIGIEEQGAIAVVDLADGDATLVLE